MAGTDEFHATVGTTGQLGNKILNVCGNAITELRRKFNAMNSYAHGTNDIVGNDELDAEAESTGQFGNNFLKTVANDTPGNLIMSALSAEIVLAMTAYGAGGRTATQMRSALFIPADDEVGQSGYQSLIETLNDVKGVELRLANKVYIASEFEVKPGFKELTAQKFYSLCEEVDFDDSKEAAKIINTWCEEKTNHRIRNLMPEDALNRETALVLVNAAYFNGQWEEKFACGNTKDRPFHIDEHTTKCVPTMFIEHHLRFGNLLKLSAKFIEIPYKEDEVSMIIIVPNEVNGLQKIQDNLHQVNLKRRLQQSEKRLVDLFLPKFKIESTLDLEETLKKLGMNDMFENEADFSGISETRQKVSKVIQKAFIEVNEKGTEAAAATVLSTKATSGLDGAKWKTFEVDRPYYYAIFHRDTGISVFTGIVRDPDLK